MKDPVISSDGHTYEREMIVRHMRNECRSPMTLTDFLFPYLIPNWNIRKAIQSYIDDHPPLTIVIPSDREGTTTEQDSVLATRIDSEINSIQRIISDSSS